MSKGSGMPQMGRAFGGWAQRMSMIRIVESIVDGLLVNTEFPFVFRGTVQPLNPKAIMLKPEGQRAWEWLQVHCFSTAPINVNDRVIYNRVIYKVMAQNDYSLNGFIEYHLVKDYQTS